MSESYARHGLFWMQDCLSTKELERKLNVQTYMAYTSESETDVSEDEGVPMGYTDGVHRHQTHPRAASNHQRGFPIVSNSHSWSQPISVPSSPSRTLTTVVSSSPTSVISESPKRPIENSAGTRSRGSSSTSDDNTTRATTPL